MRDGDEIGSERAVRRQCRTLAEKIGDGGVVGLAARHELHPGLPLHAADLAKPEVVQRNDTVTIVFQAPGLVLTLRGVAQEGGAIGDSIGVLNADSKRVVQAQVTAPGRVSVSAVTTRVVENTSPVVVSPSVPGGQSE